MQSARHHDAGDIITFGFGTSVAMWTVGYFSRLPGIHLPSAVLFLLLVVVLLASGFLAARHTPRGTLCACWSGAVTGLINLLVLGSLLMHPDDGALVPSMLLWLPGSILATCAITSVGAIAGRAMQLPANSARLPINWGFYLVLVAAVATLILLSVGGTVTGFEAGLAVPDWPNSYGYNMFAFPLARMTGGIYYEHAHRLFGALVGLTTLTTSIYCAVIDRRASARFLAALATVLVITQGILGGTRVTEVNTVLAITHGVFGQCFFATLVIFAGVMSDLWRNPLTPRRPVNSSVDRILGLVAIGALLLQLIFGALLRHLNWGLLVHVMFALAVIMIVGAFAIRAWASSGETEWVTAKIGGGVLFLLGAQLALGLFALVVVLMEKPGKPTVMQVLVTTAHQTNGALLMAFTALLAAWRCRLDMRTPFNAALSIEQSSSSAAINA